MAPFDRALWPELGPLLDQALDLSAEERDGWLDQLTTTSPEVAAALKMLLSADSLADRRGFLAEPRAVRPVATLAGLQVGQYTLVRSLGQGGMGSVWLARRTDGRYEGQVAVKLMSLALMSEAGQERFRREGTALARVAHPAIARLLDAGVAPSGQPYLVIEYVDGRRIDEYAELARLSREDRLRLVLQVLDAVAHAHANLIVHRDLKPSNILVTTDGRVKLLDFGIAKLLRGDGEEERTALTAEAGSALTPDYAAPEQITGATITTATDVYAVGVLLYLLLSGRHPTRAATSTAAESVRAVLEVEPKRLGLGDLDTILQKALRKAPAERYQTVTALADDLRRYLQHEPVSARPDSLAYRARKFVRRNRLGVIGAAVVAAILIGATAFSVAQARRATTQRDIAVAASRRAAALSQLQSVLAGDNRGVDGQPLTTAERIALAEEVLVQQFRGEPWLVAEVLLDLAGAFFEAGDAEADLAMRARARAIAREAGQHPQDALASCMRASTFWAADVMDSVPVELAQARTALARIRGPADATVRAICLEAEAKGLHSIGNADSAVALLRQALAIVDSAGMDSYRTTIVVMLSDMLRLAGRAREGLPYQLQQLDEMEAAGLANTDGFPNMASFVERSLADLGEYRVVDSVLGTLIRRQEAVAGTRRVPLLIAFLYGHNKLRLGEIDSANHWVARASVDGAPRLPLLVNWLPPVLAQIRIGQGRLSEARVAAAAMPTDLRGRRATAAMVRARLLDAEGDRAAAVRLLEGELAQLYRESAATLSLFALPLVTAGEWRLAAGDARGADSLARLGVAAAALDSLARSRSALVGRAELLLARALAARGDSAARSAGLRANAALTNGYGARNHWTGAARALLDSLPP